MILGTAFFLGLAGSLHCAGMCGPLAMAVPVLGRNRWAVLASRLIYNLGRVVTYALLGLVFGLIGQTFALAGFQRWVSLVTGALILIGLFFGKMVNQNKRLPDMKMKVVRKNGEARTVSKEHLF